MMMGIRPIRTEADHEAALTEIERLWGAKPGTRESEKLEVLATLVEVFEHSTLPTPAISPLGVLHFAIEEMGRSQSELAELLGSRSRASEVLSGKRPLTLEMVQKISSAWRIPAEVLIAPSAPNDKVQTKAQPMHAPRSGHGQL
jgi:HTH-type transcriptional regulator / antitoxin HigA